MVPPVPEPDVEPEPMLEPEPELEPEPMLEPEPVPVVEPEPIPDVVPVPMFDTLPAAELAADLALSAALGPVRTTVPVSLRGTAWLFASVAV